MWSEAANPTPGFHQKDTVENYLHDQVCKSKITLAAAQQLIATNWQAVYSDVPATIPTESLPMWTPAPIIPTQAVVPGSIHTVLNTTLSPAQPVPYHALVPASPAVDAIPLTAKQNCALPSCDQTNAPRPLDGNRDGTAACDVGASEAAFHILYLPALLLNRAPDLVGSLTLAPNKTTFAAGEPVLVTAVVTNQGNSATASGFWVDFYVNPAAPPAVNQPWYFMCSLSPCQGIAWYVDVALAPGQSITLTSSAGSYAPGYTVWPSTFVAGTSDLYLYVDSWNPPSTVGAVPEANEANNRAELHGLVVTGPSVAQATAAANFADRWILPTR